MPINGSSATTPNRLYAVDLAKNKPRLLLDPGEDNYEDIVFGKVENWVAELPDGMKLERGSYEVLLRYVLLDVVAA